MSKFITIFIIHLFICLGWGFEHFYKRKKYIIAFKIILSCFEKHKISLDANNIMFIYSNISIFLLYDTVNESTANEEFRMNDKYC